MFLRTALCKITIGSKVSFETGDGFLLDADVLDAEQERASGCSITIFDPGLRFLNLFMTQFQTVGGILIPKGLFAEERSSEGLTPIVAQGGTNPSATAANITGSLTGDDLAKAIIVEAKKNGVTQPEQIAYIIATVERESDLGRVMVEQGSRSYFNYLEGRTDIGNTSAGDGFKYRGRGFIQLTGKINYARWSKLLGIDLVNNPDLAAEPKYALPILIISMRDGLTTGRKLSQYIRPGSVDYFNARRVVNSTDRAELIAGYARKWLARLPSLESGTATATATPSAIPSASAVTNILKDPDAAEAKKPGEVDISQGIVIKVELSFNDSKKATTYEYLLTGVSGGSTFPHTTKIVGKGVRYTIGKQAKTFKVYRNISIAQLATQIAQKVGANITIADTPEAKKIYETIQQKETDYQLLVKLAKNNGLFLRGDAKTLKVETLKASDKVFIVERESLLSANWGDSASDDRILTTSEDPKTKATPIPGSAAVTTTAPTSTGAVTFISPTAGVLSRGIIEGRHFGLDVANSIGTTIIASAGGTVTYASFQDGGYGNLVKIQHNASTETRYAHGSQILVQVGQVVSQGQAIMKMGSTGRSTGSHLHFEIRVKGTPIDPLTVLPPLVNNRMQSAGQTPNSTANDASSIPSASAVTNQLTDPTVVTVPPGIQSLTKEPDEKTGIGKGFEGDLSLITARQPEALDIFPGTIIRISTRTGFGAALTRQYRISSRRHRYSKDGLQTSITFYLPVSVKSKSSQSVAPTATTTPTAGTGTPVAGGLPIPAKVSTYIYMTPTGRKDQFNANIYKVALIREGKEVDAVEAVCGYNRKSPVLRSQDYSGSGNPCPTGVFKLDPVRIGGNAAGVGKYWIGVNGTSPRSAIGFHSDVNRYVGSSGTAGCIGIIDPDEGGKLITSYPNTLKVVGWRNSGVDTFVVNHGLTQDNDKYLKPGGWV